MKIKIYDEIHYQLLPETEDMIDLDITEEELSQIGITKCFNLVTNTIEDYKNPDITIAKNKIRMRELSDDIIQDQAGILKPNIEEKKQEFYNLLNETRILEGKEVLKLK